MSRHNLKTAEPNLTAVIGWDGPMQTFFTQVTRVNPDDEDDYETVVWEGTKVGQHKDLSLILMKLAGHCTVPVELLKQLTDDQGGSTTPSPLQQKMLLKFGG